MAADMTACQASRVDLISLDNTPNDVVMTIPTPDSFEEIWDAMENSNSRGWCESSMDNIVRLLQSLQHSMRVIAVDQPPFEGMLYLMCEIKLVLSSISGELKVLVIASSDPARKLNQCAALRLRESEEESCLWRLRCDDVELRTTIKRLLDGI